MEAFTADISSLIIFAVAGALIFLYFQRREFFNVRPIIKASMGIFLALACLLAAPKILIFMAIGFALSALGDYFLDLPDDNFFIPGLISFFAAHLAYLAYLAPYAFEGYMGPFLPAFTLFAVFSLGFYLWLRPGLDKSLRLPVASYSGVIALMGMAATTSYLPYLMIPIGALLFIASDVVLAIEKFKFSFPHAKTLNWVLYASGQIILAVGAIVIARTVSISVGFWFF